MSLQRIFQGVWGHGRFRRACLLTIAIGAMAQSSVQVAGAQAPISLSQSAASPDARSYVSAVAELPDGRLVVVDMLERAVLIYSPSLDSIGSVGSVGQGPREFLVPHGLSIAPDGRVLIQDVGNARMLEVDQAGELTGEVITADRVPAGRAFAVGDEVPVIDESGRWYFGAGRISGDEREGVLYDSIGLARWSEPGGLQRVGSRPVRRSGGQVRRLSETDAPFSQAHSDWAVCGDGTVYVGLPDPYRIRVLVDGNQLAESAQVEFQSVEVTDDWVDRWWDEVGESTPSPVLQATRGGGSGFALRVDERRRLDLPDELPAMRPNGVHCGPANRAWVERYVDADQPPRIDVFDQTGTRIQRFDLPMGARIVGFGDESVYVVVRDQFDLEYLTRLAVPIG